MLKASLTCQREIFSEDNGRPNLAQTSHVLCTLYMTLLSDAVNIPVLLHMFLMSPGETWVKLWIFLSNKIRQRWVIVPLDK